MTKQWRSSVLQYFEVRDAGIFLSFDRSHKNGRLMPERDLEPPWSEVTFARLDMTKTEDEVNKNLATLILKSGIRYVELKALCTNLRCIPVSSASAEHSFSTVNQLITKLRSRMGQETSQNCV
jgi:hypothetical protein